MYIILAFFLIDDFISDNGLFFIVIPTLTYLCFYLKESFESTKKYGTILNSLPIKRNSIVKIKYIIILILYFINLVIGVLTFYLLKQIGVINYELTNFFEGFLISFGNTLIIAGIGIPSIIKFSQVKAKFINVFIYILLVNLMLSLKHLINLHILMSFAVTVCITGLIIYTTSYNISKKIYSNKEF